MPEIHKVLNMREYILLNNARVKEILTILATRAKLREA